MSCLRLRVCMCVRICQRVAARVRVRDFVRVCPHLSAFVRVCPRVCPRVPVCVRECDRVSVFVRVSPLLSVSMFTCLTISLIRNSYEDMVCRVVHAGQLTDSFMVKTGVRQGCLLSPFLFLLAIDWIMKTTTKNRRNRIQWTPWSQLEDLDFADDLALLSHSHK